jgi:hypothetical protein
MSIEGDQHEWTGSNPPEPLPAITRFVPIPKIFHSVEKDMPFQTCLFCGENLLYSNRYYVIEKVFRRSDVIIEMAMCLNCRAEQSEDGISQQSALAIKGFLNDRINVRQRLEMMATVSDSDSIDPWLERCLLTDDLGQMQREYQLIALCKGTWLQRDFYPALISGEAVNQIAELLSQGTKDWMDDFIGSNFGLPSEFCRPPKFSPVLI